MSGSCAIQCGCRHDDGLPVVVADPDAIHVGVTRVRLAKWARAWAHSVRRPHPSHIGDVQLCEAVMDMPPRLDVLARGRYAVLAGPRIQKPFISCMKRMTTRCGCALIERAKASM